MKPNTCLVVDVWEGQLEIDEAVLKANGVAGMGIRLNDMNGGHHMDLNFLRQWNEARNFVRFPYFVYNPWVDGAANFAWLSANVPADVKVVALDLEVRKTGYPAATYAKEVARFLELAKSRWKIIIYTAQWFLPYLESWPRIDYWWAQYPDPATYFGGVKTWEEVKSRLDRLDLPFNVNTIPGTLKMWQFSGDYVMLPGCRKPIDLNLFYGTAEELAAYFGSNQEPPKPQHMYYRILHDTELEKWGYQPRTMKGVDATPETVRINGGVGSVKLSAAWVKFITLINTEKANQYIRKPYNGWLNRGKWPQVEQLSFGGNVVEVTEIDGDRAYIKCLYNDEAPPALVGEFYDPATMHIFGVIRKDGTLESPPVGNTRVLVMARNRAEKLWIPLNELVKVDKLTVYVPPGKRVDPPISKKSGLYYFSGVNYFQRPGGGPLTLPMSRQRKLGDNLTRVYWPTLKKILLRLNAANPSAIDLISAKDWGPSKGLDGNYIKWIGLLWPGRNVVKIEEVVDGWGRVEGVGLFKNAAADGVSTGEDPAAPEPTIDLAAVDLNKFNAIDNPDLVSMVYDFNKQTGYGERAKPVYVPILGGPWWVDMSKLVSIDSILPKVVTVKAFPRLRVRSGPGSEFPITGYKYFGDGVAIEQVTIGPGGIWGKFSEGWIALRHTGTNWTDWRV